MPSSGLSQSGASNDVDPIAFDGNSYSVPYTLADTVVGTTRRAFDQEPDRAASVGQQAGRRFNRAARRSTSCLGPFL
jgi:hypothetical protein